MEGTVALEASLRGDNASTDAASRTSAAGSRAERATAARGTDRDSAAYRAAREVRAPAMRDEGSAAGAAEPSWPGSGGAPAGSTPGLAAAGVLTSAALAGALKFGSAAAFATRDGGIRTSVRAARRYARAGLRRVPFLPAGYSRYDDTDPLDHDVRERVYDAIADDPGVHLSALGDAADASLSTVRYHLRVLEHERLVATRKLDGKRRYFPVGTDDEALRAALQDSTRAALLYALADDGPAPNGALADELDRDPSTVTHHLQRLADAGLVERERDGRRVVNSLTSSAADALEPNAATATPADD
ncbi:MAG: winged helix-turn-helix transcriptional regulator [Halobacterium sp.]